MKRGGGTEGCKSGSERMGGASTTHKWFEPEPMTRRMGRCEDNEAERVRRGEEAPSRMREDSEMQVVAIPACAGFEPEPITRRCEGIDVGHNCEDQSP